MRMPLIFSFVFALLISCGNRDSDDTEMYVGSYRIMDQMVPYPYIFQQKNDSFFFFNNKGILIDKIKSATLKDTNEFRFKENHLRVLHENENGFLVYDSLDTLNFKPLKNGEFNPKNRAQFEKISSSNKLDLSQVKKEIKSIVWKYDVIQDENSNVNEDLEIEHLMHFQNDRVTVVINYYYEGLKLLSQHETKAYFIFQIDQNFFLSYQKEEDNPQPIYQIIDYNSKQLQLKDFSSRDIKEITFHKTSIGVEEYESLINSTTEFSNCFDGYQDEYYFGDDVTFKKGNEYIIEHINVDAPQSDSKSGYIIVHFNINCRSEVGNFGLIQMDRNFKKTSFSKEMVKHLLTKVQELKDFPSSETEWEWLHYKDVHAFLMFKLEKGKIIDLCP